MNGGGWRGGSLTVRMDAYHQLITGRSTVARPFVGQYGHQIAWVWGLGSGLNPSLVCIFTLSHHLARKLVNGGLPIRLAHGRMSDVMSREYSDV